MKLIACDPGLGGAFCFYDTDLGRMDVEPMPTYMRKLAGRKTKRKTLDEHALYDLICRFADEGAEHLFIEQVGGMPGQSAPAAFNFGHSYGAVRMAALSRGLAIEPVPAASWKALMRVPANKTGARQRANEAIPTHRHLWTRACDDGKAEAALLALYGFRCLNGGEFTHRSKKDVERVKKARAAQEDSKARRRLRAESTKARLAAIGSSDNPDLARSLF